LEERGREGKENEIEMRMNCAADGEKRDGARERERRRRRSGTPPRTYA
jgi:hypothetical protein